MTLKRARRILGKNGKGLTDGELTKEIEMASFLAQLVLSVARTKKLP